MIQIGNDSVTDIFIGSDLIYSVYVGSVKVYERQENYYYIDYASTNGNIVTPYNESAFGAVIIDNYYDANGGHLKFATPPTSIGEYAFKGCTYLQRITVPSSVTSFGVSAFENCVKFKIFTNNSSATALSNRMFYGCTALGTLNGMETITSIGDYAFYRSGFTNVSLTNIDYIGNSAFRNCTKLGTVDFLGSPTITQIRPNVFSDCSSLVNISLPSTVTTISSYAFSGCSSLTSFTLGSNVSTIGTSAFYGCINLSTVTINYSGDDLSILNSAFRNCPLTAFNGTYAYIDSTNSYVGNANGELMAAIALTGSVELPSEINEVEMTSITADIMEGRTQITELRIPETYSNIGIGAFNDCSALIAIYAEPLTPPTLGGNPFDGTNDCPIYVDYSVVNAYKTSWTSYESRIFITPANNVIYYTSSDEQVITPPSYTEFGANIVSNTYVDGVGIMSFDGNVTTIGYNAFYQSNLTFISVPNTVTSLGNQAFYGCGGLTEINLPNACTSIGNGAFQNCTYLSNIISWNGVTTLGQYAFYNCTHLTSVDLTNITSLGQGAFENSGLTSVNIPSGLSTVGSDVFMDCTNLTTVVFASGWQYGITERMFYGCTSLVNLTLPTQYDEIRDNAFNGCTSLTSIELGDTYSIGENAFYGCSGLHHLTLYGEILHIESYAFAYCTSLEDITVTFSTPSELGSGAFAFTNDCPIYVPAADVATFKSDWSEYESRIVGSGGGPTIPTSFPSSNREVWYTSTDGNIITPYETTWGSSTIASNVYSGGKGVIIFNTTFTSVPKNAFLDCTTLESVTIFSTSSIGTNAFSGCSNLKSFAIKRANAISSYTIFSGCTKLEQIYIGGPTSNSSSTQKIAPILQPAGLTVKYLIIDNLIANPNVYVLSQGRLFATGATPPNYFRIYIASGMVDTYKADTNWSQYSSIINAIP